MFNSINIGLKTLNNINSRQDNTHDDQDNNSFDAKLLDGLKSIRQLVKNKAKTTRVSALRRLRSKSNQKSIMRAFVHYCLCHVIPSSVWSVTRSDQRISKIFTIQDEAFVLIVMMNNWEIWEKMAAGEKRERGKNWDEYTLFTNKKVIYNDREVLIKGWSNEGLNEFNNIINYLYTIRNSEDTIRIENQILEEYRELDSNRCGKRKRSNNDEVILADRVMPFDGYSQTFVQV